MKEGYRVLGVGNNTNRWQTEARSLEEASDFYRRNYPCPCCGYLMFKKEPESHEICEICFWQDDSYQLRSPNRIGANGVSLIEGQKNYARTGAAEAYVLPYVRPVYKSDRRDPTWRPIDLNIDYFEFKDQPDFDTMDEKQFAAYLATPHIRPIPSDNTRLYYWRENYWLKNYGLLQEASDAEEV